MRDTGTSGETWNEGIPTLNGPGESPLQATARASKVAPEDRGLGDDVASAFIAVALARLERDHVALLAAMCDLSSPGRNARAAVAMTTDPALRDALLTVLRDDLRQTQRALGLAAKGEYGYCEACHSLLPTRTLLEHPATTLCGGCAAAQTRAQQIH